MSAKKQIARLSRSELESAARELLSALEKGERAAAGAEEREEAVRGTKKDKSPIPLYPRQLPEAAGRGEEAATGKAEFWPQADGVERSVGAGEESDGAGHTEGAYGQQPGGIAAPGGVDMGALSECFRRDSRRYDGGFKRY